MIRVNGSARPEALARLDVLDGKFLTQHTEVPLPEAPDSLAIVSLSADDEG